MAAALLVVPALAAAWLWVAPRGRAAAVRALAAGGATMVAVGGAWPLLVALTPASDRPWISGTADNSILSLIVGYNGLGRLDGQAGGPGGTGGFGGAGSLFGGETGPLRLLNQALGGQAGWLAGFALIAGIAILAASRLRRSDPRTGWLIASGGAFLTIAVAFSTAKGIFHPYYVSLLAPLTAVLTGAGVAQLAKRDRVATVLAPLAVAAAVLCEVKILRDNASLAWLPPLLLAGGMGAALVLANVNRARARLAALAAALALLLVAPAAWAAQTLGHATNGTFPAGGPSAAGFGAAPFERAGQGVTAAVAYAQAHGGGTVAVSSQSDAAGAIIASGADVAGIGGFSGRESEVTVAWLADSVQSGRIRWVLTTSQGGLGGMNDGRTGATTAMNAVQRSCTAASAVSGLYDCQGQAAALSGTS
jgi:4-amino-4-deoxy-L-arabinose transferase-like glycosyltransferase